MSSSNTLPIVAVFGSTGAQGGSVVRALSATGKYQIRALTRNPEQEKAKKLASEYKNVEVVKCDLNSTEEVNNAVKGSWAVFGLTNFWDPEVLKNHKLEIEHGERIINASDEFGVKYLVLSTLPGANEESNGKYSVPHFDQKMKLQKYAQTKKNVQSIFFFASEYASNFFYYYPPVKQADGSYFINLPQSKDAVHTIYDVNDTGAIVAAVLEEPQNWVNKEITSGADQLSNTQVCETLSKVFNAKIIFNEVTREQYKAATPELIWEELYDMLRFFEEYGVFNDKTGKRNPFVGRDILKVKMKTFEQFLKEVDYWKLPQ